MMDHHTTYAVGEDDDGVHTALAIDSKNQWFVLIQKGDEEGDPDDVVALAPIMIKTLVLLMERHLNSDMQIIETENVIVN